MFGGSTFSPMGASVVDAFTSAPPPPALLTSRQSQKDAYKQAVNDAWDNGNNTYAAAAKLRRQQRGTVVQQGITPSPLQPALSQLGYNSGGHASLALRPGMPPLPTSVNAPALAPNPNAPGLPQNPLGLEMGRGSSMYAKGIPNNGMPDLWSSTCLAQGEFAGTYKDPITGITYAMITEPSMEGVSERDVHAVYERNKPSRALEALTGVPASNVLVPQPKEQYAGPLAVIESQPPLPSQISEYVRARQTQAAVLQTFDASATEMQYGLQEDGFKDGMLGTTYILRPRYDTQTLMDNDETNTGVMNRFPIPNTDGSDIEFPDPSRSLETRPVFYMARPKPSLPTRTYIDLEDAVVQGPRQEVSDRLQRQMASMPSRTQVNLEDTNAVRQDVYDRLPQGRDTVVARAPDALVDGFQPTRVPLISEQFNDATAALPTRQTISGVDSDVYGHRALVSESASARDAGVLNTRQVIGGVDVARTATYQVREGDDGRDGARAAVVQRIQPSGEFVGNRAWTTADSGQTHDAKVAVVSRTPFGSEDVVNVRSAQTADSGHLYFDRAAVGRQGAQYTDAQFSVRDSAGVQESWNAGDYAAAGRQGVQYTDAQFGVRQGAGVQESWNAGDRAARAAVLYPDIDLGGVRPVAVAADGDMGDDGRVVLSKHAPVDVGVVGARLAQVDEGGYLNAGAVARSVQRAHMGDSFMGVANQAAMVMDGGLGSQGQTAMPFALPRIDSVVLGHRAVAVNDAIAKEKAGSKPGAVMHVRPVLEDADNLGQVRVVFADSSRADMADPIVGEHTLHGFDLANALSQFKPAHWRDDYAPMQTDRHGLVVINPEIEREESNPANAIRDFHAIKAYRKSQEANAHKNPVMCMTRESYETDAYDTDA